MLVSADQFDALIRQGDMYSRQQATQTQATAEFWHQVMRHYPEHAFWMVQNPSLPSRLLEAILQNAPSLPVVHMAARKAILSEASALQLAQHPEAAVRLSLAKNPQISAQVLAILAQDIDPSVRQIAQAQEEKLAPYHTDAQHHHPACADWQWAMGF
ncbi:hypothetical protein SAMN05421831_101261 [Allopseudospirillum japonicum]|uniref:Leucine rich repeat variant n=1 Tax=Allopseudospirillum japonicum TaxID=64971 RepID=A0A1H6Q792_9GAMM|nr:hypothetical protein [Allopseudospirillum japonicum]SEI39681.1 hypothetical protein SAMN05421831_101261 [Allopseudospirillum japonicum]